MKKLFILAVAVSLSLSVAAQSRVQALQGLTYTTWRNQDTAHSGVHKFHIDATGAADLYFYDSTGSLKNKLLMLDRFYDNFAIFKSSDSGHCIWFAVSTSGLGSVAGSIKITDANIPFDKVFKTNGGRVSGSNTGAPCPPNCPVAPARMEARIYFTNVSCCINSDHTKHHCGSTDADLAKFSKTYGCVFDN
jgi:hypothetical protein